MDLHDEDKKNNLSGKFVEIFNSYRSISTIVKHTYSSDS